MQEAKLPSPDPFSLEWVPVPWAPSPKDPHRLPHCPWKEAGCVFLSGWPG